MNIYFLAAIALAVLVIIILFWLVIRVHIRLASFMRGSSAASLESVMKKLLQGHTDQIAHHTELAAFVNAIDKRVASSHRGFAITRFNAFEHTGGNQSFACAILDENGNGMVLSSLYSRERSNVFAKPIVNFKSEFELTKEEKQVVKDASENLNA